MSMCARSRHVQSNPPPCFGGTIRMSKKLYLIRVPYQVLSYDGSGPIVSSNIGRAELEKLGRDASGFLCDVKVLV